MKTRKRARRNQIPNGRWGWKNKKRVVRISFSEATLCDRLGISIEDYAKELVAGRTK